MGESSELAGRFRLEEALSWRGVVRTFRGTHPETGEPVAVKILASGTVPEAGAEQQRFRSTAGVLKTLDHPNLPPLLDFGVSEEGEAFLVFRWLDCESLEQMKELAPRQILPYMLQAIEGLECLALHGLVHLNLEPDNVVVTRHGEVKLFGLGRSLMSVDWQSAPAASTPAAGTVFTAPELRRAPGAGGALWRADLYALAMMTARLLAAEIDGEGTERPRVRLPGSISRQLQASRSLEEALERCLLEDPSRRMVSYSKFGRVLQHSLPRTPRADGVVRDTQAFDMAELSGELVKSEIEAAAEKEDRATEAATVDTKATRLVPEKRDRAEEAATVDDGATRLVPELGAAEGRETRLLPAASEPGAEESGELRVLRAELEETLEGGEIKQPSDLGREAEIYEGFLELRDDTAPVELDLRRGPEEPAEADEPKESVPSVLFVEPPPAPEQVEKNEPSAAAVNTPAAAAPPAKRDSAEAPEEAGPASREPLSREPSSPEKAGRGPSCDAAPASRIRRTETDAGPKGKSSPPAEEKPAAAAKAPAERPTATEPGPPAGVSPPAGAGAGAKAPQSGEREAPEKPPVAAGSTPTTDSGAARRPAAEGAKRPTVPPPKPAPPLKVKPAPPAGRPAGAAAAKGASRATPAAPTTPAQGSRPALAPSPARDRPGAGAKLPKAADGSGLSVRRLLAGLGGLAASFAGRLRARFASSGGSGGGGATDRQPPAPRSDRTRRIDGPGRPGRNAARQAVRAPERSVSSVSPRSPDRSPIESPGQSADRSPRTSDARGAQQGPERGPERRAEQKSDPKQKAPGVKERKEARAGAAASSPPELLGSIDESLELPGLPEPDADTGKRGPASTKGAPSAPKTPEPPSTSRPRSPQQRLALAAGLVAVLLAIALVAVFGIGGGEEDLPSPAAEPPPPPSPPAAAARAEPVSAAAPALPSELEAAIRLLGEDRLLEARAQLDRLGAREEEGELAPELCEPYLAAEGLLLEIRVPQVETALGEALSGGEVDQLRRTLAELSSREAAVLGETSRGRRLLADARRAREQVASFEAAVNGDDPGVALNAAFALDEAFPSFGRSVRSRERASAAAESEADRWVEEGRLEEARERLELLLSLWPERPGVAARLRDVRRQLESEARFETVLTAVTAAERRRRPHEGLRMLEGVRPSGEYAERFDRAGRRLRAQLRELDAEAPKVAIKPGTEVAYRKGEPVIVELAIEDDYEVTAVTFWVRPTSEQDYQQIRPSRLGDGTYRVEIEPSLHGNKPLHFWVSAEDRSGHTGRLGSLEEPIELKRRRWLRG